MNDENKKTSNQKNNQQNNLYKLIMQLHAKIDLIKGCVMRLDQKIKSK